MSALDLDKLLEAYAALPPALGLPPLAATRVAVETARIAEGDGAAVLALLEGKEAGWIAFRSGVDWFSPDRPLRAESVDLGPVLAAELAAGAESLRLWFDGAAGGGWRLVRWREGAAGEAFLAEELTYLSETWREGGGNLRYRRYWGAAGDGSLRPRHARFLGFTAPEA